MDEVAEVDFEWVGALAPIDPSGDNPASNLGDQSDGAGTAAVSPQRSPLGFYGGAAPADSNGAAVMLQMTLGHDRTVVACSDDRELRALDGFGGPTRAPSDRFVTSYGKNSRLELRTSSADSIGFFGETNRQIKLDDAGNVVTVQNGDGVMTMDGTTVTVQNGSGSVALGPSSVLVTWASGGSLNVRAALSNIGMLLSFTDASGMMCSVNLLEGGEVAITTVPGAGGSPSGITVNGTPLIVP